MPMQKFSVGLLGVLLGVGHIGDTRLGLFFIPEEYRSWAALALTILCLSGLYVAIVAQRNKVHSVLMAGWAGFCFYLTALHWIGESLAVDHTRYEWLSVWGSIGITAIFFPFWMLATALFQAIYIYPIRNCKNHPILPLLFASCWSFADLLLSDFAYGIPLGLFGVVVLDTSLDKLLPAVGVHGVNFLLLWFSAELGSALVRRKASHSTIAPLAAALVAIAASFAIETPRPVSEISVAAIQPNARVPITNGGGDFAERTFADNLRSIKAAFHYGADVVLLPEGAFYVDFAQEPEKVAEIAAAIPEGRFVLAGSREYQISGSIVESGITADTYNVSHVFDHSGIAYTYRKTHLVLFGEYMPWIFAIFGYDVLGGPAGGLSTGSGLQETHLTDLPSFITTICFEGLLSGPVQRAMVDASWIVNISNETLFGTTVGPALINQYDRLRAIELGTPMVRSAMTSFTGVIDSQGNQLDLVKAEAFGILVHNLKTSDRNTLFRKIGYFPLYLILMTVLVSCFLTSKGRVSNPSSTGNNNDRSHSTN